jgi:hypothetical protein
VRESPEQVEQGQLDQRHERKAFTDFYRFLPLPVFLVSRFRLVTSRATDLRQGVTRAFRRFLNSDVKERYEQTGSWFTLRQWINRVWLPAYALAEAARLKPQV